MLNVGLQEETTTYQREKSRLLKIKFDEKAFLAHIHRETDNSIWNVKAPTHCQTGLTFKTNQKYLYVRNNFEIPDAKCLCFQALHTWW